MSELFLVRHGQASFGAESYDKLSERGLAQVRLLREHWQTLSERFDHVYSGTLLRQIETAEVLLPLAKSSTSAITQLQALNEYDGDPLIQAYLRAHAAAEGFTENINWPVKEARLFQQLLEAAAGKWIRRELDQTGVNEEFELFSAFRQRVHGVIDDIMARHRGGSRVLISTSGGVIAMALQRVLNCPDAQMLATHWMVHNSSITRIRYGNGRVSLTQFNSLPHLERPEFTQLITYR